MTHIIDNETGEEVFWVTPSVLPSPTSTVTTNTGTQGEEPKIMGVDYASGPDRTIALIAGAGLYAHQMSVLAALANIDYSHLEQRVLLHEAYPPVMPPIREKRQASYPDWPRIHGGPRPVGRDRKQFKIKGVRP